MGSESPAESNAVAWSGHEPCMGSVAVSGCTRSVATTRRSTLTAARPGRGPPSLRVAVTLNAPGSDPAVKTPSGVMVPPVACHSTVGAGTVSPAAVTP